MKCFWYSLIVFCLLMCSCKTQKLDSNVKVRNDVQSEVAYMNNTIEVDTTKTIRSEQINNTKVIKETTTHIIYDTDKNVVKEVTKTERSFVEDTKTNIAETESKGVEIQSQDSISQFRDLTQTIDSEVKEESIGGQESFGKWLGIILGLGIIFGIVYLCRKLRIN